MTRDRSDGWFLGTRRVLVILDLRHRTSRALSCQLRASGNRLTTQSRTVVREGRGSSMLRRRLWFVVLAAALASSGVLLAPAASASSPDSLTARAEPALTVGTVLGGLQNPWDMAFTPAGSILFTERTGPIKFRIVGGEVRQLARPADVVAQGEGGMMGVAIDPKFGTNRRVYTCFMSNKSGAL